MSTPLRTLSALTLLLALPLAGTAAGQTAFTDLTYEKAFEQSYADGKLFVIFVDAPWHRQCRAMAEKVWTDPDLVAWAADNAIVVDLDTSKQPDMAAMLDVVAVPAVVVYREGKEFDRHEGAIGTQELARMLRDIRAGRKNLDSLKRNEADLDVVGRLTLAAQLAREGATGAAAAQYVKLWGELGAPDAPMRRVPSLTDPIGDLVAEAPNTSARFLPALSEAWTRINADPTDRAAWGDWSYLGQAMGVEENMVATWLALPEDAWSRADPPPWLRDLFYELLVAAQKYPAAVRVYPDLSQRQEEDYKAYGGEMELVKRGTDKVPAARQFAIKDEAEKALRKSQAELYAVSLAAGNMSLAEQVSSRLLGELNDSRSRVALVRAGLMVKIDTVPPQFSTWLGEAEAQGGDVAALRQRLESQPR